MKLCITEKQSVAADIAKLLGATSRRDGYFEGDGIRVTWTIGHLCCLFEPHDYMPQWKQWYLSSLPMIPERFDIKVIDDPGIRRQFAVVKSLIGQADEIVNCGDAGQEGELIQRWVMKLAGTKCPVSRLWISSLTDEAISDGFAALKPQKDFDRLFYAGLSRAIGDWILGMNATRLYTLKYSQPGTVLSIGRVQTPTLALIVKRQKEIAEFVPRDSWNCTPATATPTSRQPSTASTPKPMERRPSKASQELPLPLPARQRRKAAKHRHASSTSHPCRWSATDASAGAPT